MADEQEQAQHAQVGDLHLETWTVDDRYFWSVRDFAKNVDIDSGEAATLDGAKVAAKKAARVRQDVTWSAIRPEVTCLTLRLFTFRQ